MKLWEDRLWVSHHDLPLWEKFKSCLCECQVISVAEGNHFQFQYGAISKNRKRNRNSLNKHFTSKTYGDELVFDQIK
jgi:hypothetical protein